jgi:hypothetical protein
MGVLLAPGGLVGEMAVGGTVTVTPGGVVGEIGVMVGGGTVMVTPGGVVGHKEQVNIDPEVKVVVVHPSYAATPQE